MHRNFIIRLLWCGLGVAAGVSLAIYLVEPIISPLLFAPIGGSAIFLFGMTRASAAQPRALLGGHLSGALIGVVCYHLFGDAIWVYAVAQMVALWFMLTTRTVHPPAGANPVIMIYGHANYASLLSPVLVSIVSLAVVASIWSRMFPGLVRYPLSWFEPSPSTALWGGWDV